MFSHLSSKRNLPDCSSSNTEDKHIAFKSTKKKAPQRCDLAIYFHVARSRNSIPKAGGCCNACPSGQCAQQVTEESAAIVYMAGSQSGDCLPSISTSSTWCSLRRPFPFYPIIRASWKKSVGNQGCTTALTYSFPQWAESPARVPNIKSSKYFFLFLCFIFEPVQCSMEQYDDYVFQHQIINYAECFINNNYWSQWPGSSQCSSSELECTDPTHSPCQAISRNRFISSNGQMFAC